MFVMVKKLDEVRGIFIDWYSISYGELLEVDTNGRFAFIYNVRPPLVWTFSRSCLTQE